MSETKTWGPMTDGQRAMLYALRERCGGKATSSELAKLLDISTDAAGKTLNRLAERGIVARRADGRWTA
jgi:Mn-dependent DtxR family transcriptional regulator